MGGGEVAQNLYVPVHNTNIYIIYRVNHGDLDNITYRFVQSNTFLRKKCTPIIVHIILI